MSSEDSYARSIVLPCDQIFRNLRNARSFAIDIGGSLAKLAYCSTIQKKDTFLSPADNGMSSDETLYWVSETDTDGIRLHFVKFETQYIERCLEFIQSTMGGSLKPASKVIKATGGGAHKYFDLISSKLGLKVDKEDEMESLIKGCHFLLRNIPDESFTYHHHDAIKYRFQTVDPCAIFPYLLVNIGSGVSILKVDSENSFQRVGGTSFGGGSFCGLGSLLTGAQTFDDLLSLAERGDHRNVDMLVSDIYGGAYQKMGLPGDLIASSFGKTACPPDASGLLAMSMESLGLSAASGADDAYQGEDLARSLLLTISNCIGQLAVLYARLQSVSRIYFGGYFIRGHPITMRTISFAIDYWSKGEIQALFLRHEGYLGAVGAFLKGAEEESKLQHVRSDLPALLSWNENYAGCCGFGMNVPAAFWSQNGKAFIDSLEMDCTDRTLVPCPLLRCPGKYVPDTVDLTLDDDAREYWLQCMEKGVEKTVAKALECQSGNGTAEERAKSFQHKYLQHLCLLRQKPFAYGCLNVRSLLDLKEQLLNEFYFPDTYHKQKRLENERALLELPRLLRNLDEEDWPARQLNIAQGLLAGNVFDWGAQEVVKLLESVENFSFADARHKLQQRPWLCDDFDRWFHRLQNSTPYRCACVFVDNSGVDIALGVVPFVRELLKLGTKVILCANSRPALNDVTEKELKLLLRRVCRLCPLIASAISEKRLFVVENGQASPCLDLSRIDGGLAALMTEERVDLLVIEGMGRAIHTNFNAEFLCDSLKIAVVKNAWLAQRLGGETFGVIFKFESANELSTGVI